MVLAFHAKAQSPNPKIIRTRTSPITAYFSCRSLSAAIHNLHAQRISLQLSSCSTSSTGKPKLRTPPDYRQTRAEEFHSVIEGLGISQRRPTAASGNRYDGCPATKCTAQHLRFEIPKKWVPSRRITCTSSECKLRPRRAHTDMFGKVVLRKNDCPRRSARSR